MKKNILPSGPVVRSYGHRMGRLAAPVFLLMFTGLFFGPLDIVNSNQSYLTFAAADLLVSLLGLTLAGTLLLSALLALVPDKAHNHILGLIFALAFLFYVQGVWLDKSLITLDGSDFRWQDDPAGAWGNLALWLSAAVILTLLTARFPEILRTVIPIACVALCVAQISALAASWVPAEKDGPNYQLSGEEEFVLSDEENIIVITLDQVSPELFEDVLELDPALETVFEDFTYYNDMSASYSLTFPSLCFLLTGEEYDGSLPVAEYFQNAWSGESANGFYNALHENGYIANLYVEANYAALSAENMIGKAENVVEAGDLIVRWPLLQSAIAMSLYRYCPVMLKNPFCVPTGQVVDVAEYQGAAKVCINDDFYTSLQEQGLRTQSGARRFLWYHTKGAHFPYTVGYDGLPLDKEAPDNSESRLAQLHGFMVALADYFRQLKELGIYDDATILISADHGYYTELQVLFLIKTPGQDFEHMQISSAPVAQEDILPTVLDILGEDYSAYGRSVFDVAEDEIRPRSTAIWGYHPEYPAVPWIGNVNQWNNAANGTEHYNVLAVFDYTGDRAALEKDYRAWYYRHIADRILPLQDSFY